MFQDIRGYSLLQHSLVPLSSLSLTFAHNFNSAAVQTLASLILFGRGNPRAYSLALIFPALLLNTRTLACFQVFIQIKYSKCISQQCVRISY